MIIPDPKSIKNMLVVRNDRFGEFLLNIPAFRALKETFVFARLIAVIDPYVRELAQAVPFIDEVIEWSNKKSAFLEKLRLVKLLRKKEIDIAVMLNPTKDFNLITALAAIPLRLGYDKKCGFLLTHKMEDKKYLGDKHEIDYNLELVSLVGAKTQDKTLTLTIEEGIKSCLLSDLNIEDKGNLIAVHPWTSDPLKQWPQEKFVRLAKKLVEGLNAKVFIVGGKEEIGRSNDLFNGFDRGLINITGRTSLIQLGAVLKKCRLLVSGDSGPVHLASCVRTPVVAIFRNDLPGKNPVRWGPLGKKSAVVESPSLSDITVEEVFAKAKELLS